MSLGYIDASFEIQRSKIDKCFQGEHRWSHGQSSIDTHRKRLLSFFNKQHSRICSIEKLQSLKFSIDLCIQHIFKLYSNYNNTTEIHWSTEKQLSETAYSRPDDTVSLSFQLYSRSTKQRTEVRPVRFQTEPNRLDSVRTFLNLDRFSSVRFEKNTNRSHL